MSNRSAIPFIHTTRNVEIAKDSARVVIPLLLKVLSSAHSVVDVGCGLGAWLSVFAELGVSDVLGLDGDWVPAGDLLIRRESFCAVDLSNPDWCSAIRRRFDIVMSVEVAEHLPQRSAQSFIRSLTELGDTVLFSAAIPGQGGQNHINEQWPQYWISLFEARGFQAIDFLRPLIWNHPKVKWWFAQNIFLFCKQAVLRDNSQLKSLAEQTKSIPHDLVHPRLFSKQRERADRRSIKGRVMKISAKF